jgi:hypothetical protein
MHEISIREKYYRQHQPHHIWSLIPMKSRRKTSIDIDDTVLHYQQHQ